ncbi:MAG: response regulator transcription factor [Actinomycetota bacterium]|nr:response regulator transcription factor [Actinomycetota bacterium]MDZ4177899.1 response regulator transcription factor [Coriobacteriia bacterium]
MDPIRVFIADDHELVRYAMRTLLEGEADIEVVGEAANGREVIEQVSAANVDVLLLDLRMPEIEGIEACRAVKEQCPDTKVLVLTSFDDDEDVFGVLAVGASGYILKDTRPDRVVEAVRAVAEGQAVFDAKVAARVISGHGTSEPDAGEVLRERLSAREMEVLRLMGKGFSNKEIARALWIGETTVKTHVSHILRKLEAADRTQAVLAAVKTGLLNLDGKSST